MFKESVQTAQLWQDYESGRSYIINPKYNLSTKPWLKNGTFEAKFNHKISGTANLLKRKKVEKTDSLWRSIRPLNYSIYTPSTEKFDGYTQYPRPRSRRISNLKKKKRYYSTQFQRVSSVKQISSEIPAHLTQHQTQNWVGKVTSRGHRTTTAPTVVQQAPNPRTVKTARTRLPSARTSRTHSNVPNKPGTNHASNVKNPHMKSMADIKSEYKLTSQHYRP